MATIRNYRELIVLQKAMDLAELVYQATKQFPNEETLRADESSQTVGGFHTVQHSGRSGQKINGGVSEFSVHCERFQSRNGD